MKLFGEDKYFIGIVKFFDAKKGFGFIASNNCGMSFSTYNQDFYVSDLSFVEESAKVERCVVVFQVDSLKNGKTRAVNVRKIAKTEDDYRLALSYYGEHEKVECNDGKIVNLFNHCGVPRGVVAEHVKAIIQNEKNGSHPKTVEHIVFFIKHYKKDLISPSSVDSVPWPLHYYGGSMEKVFFSSRYIFDRDYDREEKTIWTSLASLLTEDEAVELLKKYPSFCKYIENPGAVRKWINAYSTDSSLNDLRGLNELVNVLPDEVRDDATNQLADIADKKIADIIQETINDERAEARDLEERIAPYLPFTSRNYEEEKKQCLNAINYRKLADSMTEFRNRPDDTYAMRSFFERLGCLKEEKERHIDEIEEKMREILDINLSKKNYSFAINLIKNLDFLGTGFLDSYKGQLLPLITDFLRDTLVSELKTPYSIERDFFAKYNSLTSIFDKEECKEIKSTLIPIMKESDSLYALSVCTVTEKGWITPNTAIKRANEIVSQWQFSEMREFVSGHSNSLFKKDDTFNDIIVDKGVSLVQDCKLSEFFDGTINDKENNPYGRIPERENCEFLKNLQNFISKGHRNESWVNYLCTRAEWEMIVLYNNGVADFLPEKVISYIINSISLESVIAKPEQWYYAPVLKDETFTKILQSTCIDIFPIIKERLIRMEMSTPNIPLVVLLVELLNLRRPENDDYNAKKELEEVLPKKLNELKTSVPNNDILSVILWSIYSGVSASTSSLKKVVYALPPYVQIRCVRKLFMLMSRGIKQYTAAQLYELVCDGENKLCLPLDIAFYYLKMREKNPEATLSNNNMLELLDGRENHSDWNWIRLLMTTCKGRWSAVELDDSRSNWKRGSYFNGMITQADKSASTNRELFFNPFVNYDNSVNLSSYTGKLRVFVPRKMVDESGDLTDYNNKFYKKIVEFIGKTYRGDEYEVENAANGCFYTFDNSYKIELFSMARYYNFKYGRLDNYLDFRVDTSRDELFCECRLSDKLDNRYGVSFFWCENKPCFRPPLRYMLDDEWERYSILDFMRILNIPVDYVNKNGKCTRFGHYIILSSYLRSFTKFYEHLKCRHCGKLLKPVDISNFATRAITEFHCDNEGCAGYGKVVYLNHCFNKQKCNATIDSRDSKTCPNGQYICPECGACCSTENFRQRINNLHTTGGYISDRLVEFVRMNKGHWEKGERYCHRCGRLMKNEDGRIVCENCDLPKPMPVNSLPNSSVEHV